MRKSYPSDLTDQQWAVLSPLLPLVYPRHQRGRPHKFTMREIVNGLVYQVREGCSWRALPHDLPSWWTVFEYLHSWNNDGTWQKILDTLRALARAKGGRNPMPAIAVIDSQSVKTALGGKARGVNGAKNVNGRKRHILVDSQGFLIAVVVTAANVDDARAAQDLFAQVPGRKFPRLRVIFADHKYHNYDLYQWLRSHRRPYRLEIVLRPEGQKGFKPIHMRWIVERTYAWQGRYRALSKDYEHTPESSEALIRVAAIHHLLQRLCPKHTKRAEQFHFRRKKSPQK